MPTATRAQLKQFIGDRFNRHKQAKYLELIAIIDNHLSFGTFHFHRAGRLLFTLDQVVGAILAGELDEGEVPPVVHNKEYIIVPRWMVE